MSGRLCVVISGPDFEEAQQQIKIVADVADLLEFRLDLMSGTSFEEMCELIRTRPRPCIVTMRRAANREEQERLQLLQEIVEKLSPEYVDIEHDVSDFPFHQTKVIRSFHDFSATPSDLKAVLDAMESHSADLCKLATYANSSIDALRMIAFVQKETKKGKKLLGMCMGEHGAPTRILGPIFGNEWSYAAPDENSVIAPGQLDVKTLIQDYHYLELSPSTEIYGLIGNPVTESISHLTHNAEFRRLGIDAVYCKMCVKPEELQTFLDLARRIGMRGLSVTMPLKEKVLQYVTALHPLAASAEAVNTLKMSVDSIVGFNTDGEGALETIQKKVALGAKMKVVLLGAGGAAKAVAHALKKKNVELTILNRTEQKAKELADACGASGHGLNAFSAVAERGYDLLINCISFAVKDCPIAADALLSNKIVMETVSRPKETALVREAKKKQCEIIYGEEMFFCQAAQQFQIWFGDRVGKVFENRTGF